MQHRETAQKIALQALRDASATEALVRCLKYVPFISLFFVILRCYFDFIPPYCELSELIGLLSANILEWFAVGCFQT